jgi:hypothetical protein
MSTEDYPKGRPPGPRTRRRTLPCMRSRGHERCHPAAAAVGIFLAIFSCLPLIRCGGGAEPEAPAVVDLETLRSRLDPLFRADVFRDCLEELGGKFDLTKYSTCLAADDVNDLRRAAFPNLEDEYLAVLRRLE